MQVSYDNEWPKLTNNYYQQTPWPSAAAVSPLVEDDATFLCLYKELSYRHMFAKLQPAMPTLQHRFDSFNNSYL